MLQGKQFGAGLTVYPELFFLFVHIKKRRQGERWGQIQREENEISYGKERTKNCD
jgi:hypothetical protein